MSEGPDATARFAARSTSEEGGRVRRFTPLEAGAPIATHRALELLATDEDFRRWFMDQLVAVPFDACFWETPPRTAATLDTPWEFAVIDAPALRGVAAEPHAFAEHFSADALAVAFPNLGGDAWLVAPCPGERPADGAHLMAFLRGADAAHRHALWQLVGEQTAASIGTRPLWLSACGTGVYWLHLRLDSFPKYYSYRPYRTKPG